MQNYKLSLKFYKISLEFLIYNNEIYYSWNFIKTEKSERVAALIYIFIQQHL